MMSRDVKVVVVLSGGQDSATCLMLAIDQWGQANVRALAFEYGQRHAVELVCARELCERLGVELEIIALPLAQLAPNNALTNDAIAVEVEGSAHDASLPSTFVPGRNLVFLTAAMSWALARGARVIVTGVCETDFSGYPDCRAETIRALEHALRLGTQTPCEIITPLMWLSKAQTWGLVAAVRPGDGLDLIREHTHTCYEGDHTTRNVWGYGCAMCPACRLRARGYYEFMGEGEGVGGGDTLDVEGDEGGEG